MEDTAPIIDADPIFLNWVPVYWLVYIVLGIVFGLAVYRDARRLPKLFLGTHPVMWMISAVVLGPIWVVVAYWLIHYSTISNRLGLNQADSHSPAGTSDHEIP